MGRPKAFDHEDLKNLLFAHPEWTNERYAEELTRLARAINPKASEVNRGTVSSVLARKQHGWEQAAGVKLPDRRMDFSDWMPPFGTIAEEHRNAQEIRYIRELAKEDRGIKPRGDDDWKVWARSTAISWGEAIIASGQIVDLTVKGVPITRDATKAERNSDGTSKAIAAWLLPGWRGK